MSSPIVFRRKPYQVVYKDLHTGEIKHLIRRPPRKLHDMLPDDVVELKHKKNENWDENEEFRIKHISYRAPNTLQLINDENETTFVSHSDVILTGEEAYRPGSENDEESPVRNKYLNWP